MKKIILFTCIMFLGIDCYSQKEEGTVWREAAKYLYDEGFDRDDLRNTIEIVREMSKEFFEWFNSSPQAKEVISNTTPNKNEEKCINDFYLKYIEPNKDIKTDTVEV